MTSAAKENGGPRSGGEVFLPDGLLGFEDLTRFIIVEDSDAHPFCRLQSQDDPEVMFIIVDPTIIYGNDYAVPLAESDRDVLDLASEDVVDTWVLVAPVEGPERFAANLKGPVVLNTRNRVAKQVVVYNPAYAFRHPIRMADTASDRARLKAQVYR
ncbi:MAG: flagellar assembly protein FliW [Candidatus Eisenbacteria bacterium]